MLFGTLFLPFKQVQAGFLSSFLGVGDQVYADTNTTTTNSSLLGNNLQNLAILQVNDSSQTNNNQDNSATPTATDNTGTALVSSTSGPASTDSSLDDTSVYVVKPGDTISDIAKLFNVSVNTILVANDLKKGDKLTEGDVLLILPISGVEHTVKKGETLKGIAAFYKADEGDIALYNGITEDTALNVGDQLLIPGADDMIMADEGGDKPSPNLGSALSRDMQYYKNHPTIPDIANYFIDPLLTGHKTQGLHGPGHRGIDIGAPTGTPILASASGIVLIVKTGCVAGYRSCGGGYGNMVMIQHPNGTKTLYGHMSKVLTYIGAEVNQGDTIGLVGSTGNSTGPHVHFEVSGARNPGADWSWKN